MIPFANSAEYLKAFPAAGLGCRRALSRVFWSGSKAGAGRRDLPSEHLDSKIRCYHDASMRTTVTLDPDVQQLLRDAMQRRRLSFKEALNQAIRSGLSGATNPSDDETSFVVRAQRMGLRAGIDAGRLNQMTDELEAESFDELSRTLARTLADRAHKQK
jgi:hypothetical protein